MSCFCCLYCPQNDVFRENDVQQRCETSRAMPLSVILKGLSQGTVLYKVRSADHWYRRKYKVDLQNMRLAYHPSAKKRNACTCASLATNIIDLFDLEEVRKGWNSDVFNALEAKLRRKLQARLHPQLRSQLREENCFSLVVGPGGSVVDLIAPNTHARDAWVRGLRQLIACCAHLRVQHHEERWLKELVRRADVNGNGSLTFDECLLLLNQVNISMRTSEARKLFDAANFRKVAVAGEEALEPDEFVKFYRSLVNRTELQQIMKEYSVSKSTLWGAEELRNFLKTEQQMPLSMDECDALIEAYEPKENSIQGYLSLEGLRQLLLSAEHNIFNKKHRIIYQNMRRPLNHYYIASSHNTYLRGGQLVGESSIEGYIQALMRGCRCLELDTWDGPDDEPIIFHGYTLTSRIFLKDVLQAIRTYAFRASQYPVILSIENHCSVAYQAKMASHFKNILGDFLYKDPVGENETAYPSPEALARKIFIKSKKLQMESGPFFLEEEEVEEESLAAAPRQARIAPELSDLVNYFSARRFNTFAESKICWDFCDMASFSESKVMSLAQEGADFVAHNRRHFSRVYPKGTRTDSTNFDPIPHWSLGCQMVALNYQTFDEPMFLNEAKFAQNGRCGYVLKPHYLTNEVPYVPGSKPYPDKQLKIVIKVVSGQFLPKPNRASEGEVIDPYVSIKVFGHPLDAQKRKTRFVNNNGFNPRWDESLEFVLWAPEEAIFYFRVKDENVTSNALIGHFVLPATSIAPGYRHVHLEDMKGQKLDRATIFVHVQLTQCATYRRPSALNQQ